MKGKTGPLPLIVRHLVKGRFVRGHRTYRSTQVIGSSRGSHIRLLSKEIAGVTCILEKQKTGWVIVDLGSQPDVKINGKPFVEFAITEKCILQIGEHSLEMTPQAKRRQIFTENRPATGKCQTLTVIKWGGRVVDVSVDGSPFSGIKRDDVEVIKYNMPVQPRLEREKLGFDEELKKPIMGTALSFLVFLLILLGLPTPHEDKLPPKSVFTKMIFDSSILAQKKKQLATSGLRSLRGTGNGNGGVTEGAKGQKNNTAQKAVASLRKAGLQTLISKIAGRASQSAKLIAALAATPSANASVEPTEMGSINTTPSSGAATGKSALVGNGKGFKVTGIGTSGKGGGTGNYKDQTGLGTGAIGNGEVGVEETDSIVEGGLDKEIIAGVIREHLGQIRYCYERQLSANPDLYGKIKVRFSIGADGLVDTQSIGQSTLKSAMVEECILRRIATWKFPKPKGGTHVLVSYPFLFKSVN